MHQHICYQEYPFHIPQSSLHYLYSHPLPQMLILPLHTFSLPSKIEPCYTLCSVELHLPTKSIQQSARKQSMLLLSQSFCCVLPLLQPLYEQFLPFHHKFFSVAPNLYTRIFQKTTLRLFHSPARYMPKSAFQQLCCKFPQVSHFRFFHLCNKYSRTLHF